VIRRAPVRSELLNMVAAAIIALLVWAYANDRTRESGSVSGTVRLAPSDPRERFVDPAGAVPVTVELRGSRRSIEAVENILRGGLTLAVGGPGLPNEDGANAAALRDVLGADPAIAASGAEVVRVRPESVRYETGGLVTEQVPVASSLPNAAVRGAITVEPSVVAITLPAAARQAAGSLQVEATADVRNLKPGVPQKVDVDLRVPESLSRWREQCRIVPPRASLSFELVASTADLRLARVPVRVALSPAAGDRWEVRTEDGADAIRDVVLSGPGAAIDAIASGRFEPTAVVDLGAAPERVGEAEYPVTFWRLPDGVSVVRAAGGDPGTMPTVRLRVLPRPGPSSAPIP
jgi:hypothetical protein